MIKLIERSDVVIHIPIFIFSNDSSQKEKMLSLLFVSIYSYYKENNTFPLKISTNDKEVYDIVDAFRKKTKFPYEIFLFNIKECYDFFEVEDCYYNNNVLLSYFFSKFSILMKLKNCYVIHVDYDVLFLTKVNFFKILKRNKISVISDIYLHPMHGVVHSYYANTGVFSMDCSDGVKKFIKNVLFKCNFNSILHEEELINLILSEKKYKHEFIEINKNDELNIMAYKVDAFNNTQKKSEIIHFHWMKPFDIMKINQKRGSDEMRILEQDFLDIDGFENLKKERLNKEFYFYVESWVLLFNEINRNYFVF